MGDKMCWIVCDKGEEDIGWERKFQSVEIGKVGLQSINSPTYKRSHNLQKCAILAPILKKTKQEQ